MITQLCRLGWLGSLHVLLYIPCHVLLSQARQTAVMARAKQACEEMHIDWYQPQACRHQSQQCGVVPNWLVPNPMVYIGLPMFAMILISPLNSAILETVPLQGLFLPRLIHIDDDELLYTPQHRKIGSCWQIATGTGSLSGVFHVFHQWPGLASCSAHSLPSGRDPWYPMYPMNLKSRNISKQAPFRWHLKCQNVSDRSHMWGILAKRGGGVQICRGGVSVVETF